ncbi:lysozyme inhibitor LprI family protein [Sphingopyxis sp. LC81]|uniref:lysozyme inhibitor LprI family protein n=1 Tax=Sphingopyxis sp. LC81 TaxID=1502850 RepID=UPI0009DDF2F8
MPPKASLESATESTVKLCPRNLVYRDKHCMREGYIMRGGSAEPYVYNTCRSRLTKARTAELKVLAEGQIN